MDVAALLLSRPQFASTISLSKMAGPIQGPLLSYETFTASLPPSARWRSRSGRT